MLRPHADHSRHLADHPREEPNGSRLRRFLSIDRAQERHPAVRALHARGPAPPAEGGLAPFLRILRGRRA